MVRPKSQRQAVRFSVSLDEQDHIKICRIAADLNLSAAWLVRRAVADFIGRHEKSNQSDLPLNAFSDKCKS